MSIVICEGQRIIDIEKFIKSHQSYVENCGDHVFCKPYKKRLELVKEKLKENGRRTNKA